MVNFTKMVNLTRLVKRRRADTGAGGRTQGQEGGCRRRRANAGVEGWTEEYEGGYRGRMADTGVGGQTRA